MRWVEVEVGVRLRLDIGWLKLGLGWVEVRSGLVEVWIEVRSRFILR